MTQAVMDSNDIDAHVDAELERYLNPDTPKSFFLFAGAGSGKTRSLVSALRRLRELHGPRLRLQAKRVAVISYMNAACDEIQQRLGSDPLFAVSTIHSFVWDLIRGFNDDIRVWLDENLRQEIAELQDKQSRGRPGKASDDRRRSIDSKTRRLGSLGEIRKFIYSPTGENRTRESLSHAEVIKLAAFFLTQKPLMQLLLINRFPLLLIDESQDTNRHLMDAFMAVERTHIGKFCLGLFGDTMQRIFSDGKVDLGTNLPSDWATPAKVMNHRSPKRVVALINAIRSGVDAQRQQARSDASEGHVRLFTCRHDCPDKQAVEDRARSRMAAITGDVAWGQKRQVKMLTVEHHMAAARMGFAPMLTALSKIDDFDTGLRDGSLPAVRLFVNHALPLAQAIRLGNDFAVTNVLKRSGSPLLDRTRLASASDPMACLQPAREAINAYTDLLQRQAGSVTFGEVLSCVAERAMFDVPEMLLPLVSTTRASTPGAAPTSAEGDEDAAEEDDTESKLAALREFLQTPFEQAEPYSQYVQGTAEFDTHQGVKGREFPRVLAVLDDEGARGFMFSYDRLLGVKAESSRAREPGAETGVDRTRRLFYVICSRSQQSLAIVAYSDNPTGAGAYVVQQGWFGATEVEVLV